MFLKFALCITFLLLCLNIIRLQQNFGCPTIVLSVNEFSFASSRLTTHSIVYSIFLHKVSPKLLWFATPCWQSLFLYVFSVECSLEYYAVAEL
jgi:hypothetical protein